MDVSDSQEESEMLARRLALLAVFFVLKPSLFSNRVPERRRYFAVVAFLITVVCIAILLAGGIAISVRLHNASIKGQRLSGSQRFYAAPRRYATDLTDAGMTVWASARRKPLDAQSTG